MFSNARQTLAYLPNIVMLQGRLIQGILIDDRLTFKLHIEKGFSFRNKSFFYAARKIIGWGHISFPWLWRSVNTRLYPVLALAGYSETKQSSQSPLHPTVYKRVCVHWPRADWLKNVLCNLCQIEHCLFYIDIINII